MKKLLTLVLIYFWFHPVNAQLTFKAQTGVGYLEHFTTGIGVEFSNKHQLSLLYGSNFFYKTSDFSSLLLQYDCKFNKLNFNGFTPKLGIKGGYSVYTNTYYRWNVLMLVPFVGVNRPLSKKLDLAFDLGLAVSHELSLERISYGEFGTYRKYLPEVKIGLLYTL